MWWWCRFDLFHAHLFVGHRTERLGLLFHAQEYPVYDPELFPLPLGFCQVLMTDNRCSPSCCLRLDVMMKKDGAW